MKQQVCCSGLCNVEIHCSVHWLEKGSHFRLFRQHLLQNNFLFRYKWHLSGTVGEKLRLTKHVTNSTWKLETSFCVLRSACQICVSWRNLEERLFRRHRTTKLSVTATCYWRCKTRHYYTQFGHFRVLTERWSGWSFVFNYWSFGAAL